MERQNQKPEAKFTMGAVSASVWKRSHTTKDGRAFDVHQVSIDRRYRDKNGDWKSSQSFDVNDIPKAIAALFKAYEQILQKPSGDSDEVEVEKVE